MSFPHRSIATALMNMETPMVIMMRFITEAFLTGLMASLSMRKPTKVAISRARAMHRPRGRPVHRLTKTLSIPPSMTNSPWAKLIIPVALKIIVKPRAVSA